MKDLAEARPAGAGASGAGRQQSDVFNLGNGAGYSVREIIETARRITGKEIPGRGGAPPGWRPLCPDRLQQEGRRAVLGWKPARGLEQIIADAWAWHSGHPNGYEG